MVRKSLSASKVVLSARVKTHPWVFLPVAKLRENGKRTCVRRNSDVVIEGYWRCANHYAVNAFTVAQMRPIHVAHHFHAPAQLMLAVRWNVPALLLIREPTAAVASATVYLEHDDPIPLLKFYNIFHEALVPYRERLVVSDFARTTHEFGSVIAKLNTRYGREFAVYQGTAEQEERVKELIHREHDSNMRSMVATLPLPAAEKEIRKRQIMDRLLSSRCEALLSESKDLYRSFLRAQRG